jgi:hypothetical protein
MRKRDMRTCTVLVDQGSRLAHFLARHLIPFRFRLGVKSQVTFEFHKDYQDLFNLAVKEMQTTPTTEESIATLVAKVGKLSARVPHLRTYRPGLSAEQMVDHFVAGTLEKLRELEETFSRSTEVATELKKDLAWCRAMWRLDRESLLENSTYWKRQMEKLVEKSPGSVDQSDPHWYSYHRPSEREFQAEIKQAVLQDLAKKIDKGQVKFEPFKD